MQEQERGEPPPPLLRLGPAPAGPTSLLPTEEGPACPEEAVRPENQRRGGRHSHRSLPSARRLEGVAWLLITSLFWATYAPTLRLAYSLRDPPSPVVVAAARGSLQLLLLLAALLNSGSALLWPLQPRLAVLPGVEREGAEEGLQGGERGGRLRDEAQPLLPPAQPGDSSDLQHGSTTVLRQHLAAAAVVEEGSAGQRSEGALPLGLPAAVAAALELGLFNTTGTLAQTAGLALKTAARAAFLIQASTVFTPLLAALAGMAPSRPTLLGSALALVGTLVIAADRSGLPHSNSLHPAAFGASTAHSPEASPLGDALIIFAALCYSAATVRIPAWAVRRAVPPLHLALGKSAFLATVSLAALGAEAAWLGATGRTLAGLWPGWRQAAGWACIGWSALGPGALSAFLHVKGQSLVPPTTAQICFCTIPLFSACMAAAVLPDEPLGLPTLLGGCLVAAAGAVAAWPARRPER